jgi:hypothetical protein
MVFGINILGLVKAELLKFKDKSGNPLAIDVLDDLEKGLVIVDGFASRLTPADIQAVLDLLPVVVRAKFTPTELASIAALVANLPKELSNLETAVLEAVADLKEK